MAVIFSTAALPGTRGDRYALGARQIAAIVQTLPSVALPGAPAFVQAIAAWRGVAVPVVDFTGSAGLSAGRHLIARTATGEFVAIPVNADVVLHRAAAGDQRIAVAGPRFVRGTFVIDGEQVGLVDIDALVRSDTHAASACVA
jgi:chemotaxis signal transduction protein